MKPKYQNMAECVAEFNSLLRNKLRDPAPVKAVPVVAQLTENTEVVKKRVVKAEAVRNSRYSSSAKAMDSFRVLAGLEERDLMPWNAGAGAETRTNGTVLTDAFGSALSEDGGEDEYVQKVAQRQGNYAAAQHRPSAKSDMGGYSPRAAYKALKHSARTIADMHAKHSYMGAHAPEHRSMIKQELAKRNMHAAHMLRGASDGAPEDVGGQLHHLAGRHERHAKIYMSGGRPKLESIEEMDKLNDLIDVVID